MGCNDNLGHQLRRKCLRWKYIPPLGGKSPFDMEIDKVNEVEDTKSVFKIMGISIIIGIFYRNGTFAEYWYKLGQFVEFCV